MADRVRDCDTKELQQFKENAENSNTKKITRTRFTVWTTWAEEKGYSPDIVSYEANLGNLREASEVFRRGEKERWVRLRARSLRVMTASPDRHLEEAGSSISIVKDRECFNSRKVLEGKARFLPEQGYGKRPRASKALTTEDEERPVHQLRRKSQQKFSERRCNVSQAELITDDG